MNDPLKALDDLFLGFDHANAPNFPPFPTQFPTSQTGQPIDKSSISHISHISHSGNERSGSDHRDFPEEPDFYSEGSRVTSSYAGGVGNVGNVGNGEEPPAGSTSYHFPLDSEEVGNVGKKKGLCERTTLDQDRTAPRRSDWWTGPLMAEADAASPPIPPSTVRAGVVRELRALAALGVTGPEAEMRAVAITRAKIWNSDALAERQAHDGRCHVCGEPLDDTAPVIAILTAIAGRHLALHADCHAKHLRRREALVDRIMAAAGYGADWTERAA